MKIIVTEASPEAMLTLSGDLDVGAAGPLRHTVFDLLRLGQRYLLVDLAGVTFLDSAGLRGLMFCHDLVLGAGGTFTLAGHSPAVDRLLRILDQPWVTEVLNPWLTDAHPPEER